jgi:hypothetical protein
MIFIARNYSASKKMEQKYLTLILLLLIASLLYGMYLENLYKKVTSGNRNVLAAEYQPSGSDFHSLLYTDSYNRNILEETSSPKTSLHPYFWLNSGGILFFDNGIVKTIHGELPVNSAWRIEYAKTNPADTDNGYHPQNLLRLITKLKWQNVAEEAYFKIVGNNISDSSNRNESNGIFFLSHYEDAYNTYYAGIRVDGFVIIKRKLDGVYKTIAETPYFNGSGSYNRSTNPNLLPKNSWIGLKTTTNTNPDGSVSISVYIDKNADGQWENILNGIDYPGEKNHSLSKEGFAGIRSDFMDIEINKYTITETR